MTEARNSIGGLHANGAGVDLAVMSKDVSLVFRIHRCSRCWNGNTPIPRQGDSQGRESVCRAGFRIL